ncbi:MAG: CPBP family intramembrane metalloprotease [Fidelibacterota bacterium]|nr:MAG: CPBP family intramembrane metalloprotease [Candidatus Neomarinimicrobiota bacterium]
MNNNRSILFLLLTFAVSWMIALIFFLAGGRWNTTPAIVIGIGYMYVPLIMVLIVQKGIIKAALVEPLNISFRLNRWFLVAWLLPPLIAFTTFGVSLLFHSVDYSPEMVGMFERFRHLMTPEQLSQIEEQTQSLPVHPFWITLLQGLLAGVTVNAIAAFGEELGWRGFLHRAWRGWGYWRASAIIGFIWGIWHTPLILMGHNYPQHPVAGVFMMTGFCLLWSPIFFYIREKSGSVIAAALLHGSLNGAGGFAILLVSGGNDLVVGVTGLAGLIVLALANIVLVVYDRYLTAKPIICGIGQE